MKFCIAFFIALFTGSGLFAEPVSYANSGNWASLPLIRNFSMATPSPRLLSRQATAKADVFYVYPTAYTSFLNANAPLGDAKYRRNVRRYLLTLQASSLNNVGKIYTPFYRQASLWEYFDTKAAKARAFDVAYSDVKAAFVYYLKHYNHGRPLFILSHSQGSQMTVRLLRHLYRKYRLKKILVAAYIIGERIGTRTFRDLKPCKSANQTDCFVTWATVLKGGQPTLLTGTAKGKAVCINPLSWKMNDALVWAKRHLGGVPDSFDRVEPHLVSARCRDGLLQIFPAPKGYSHDGTDYHESDINLFYVDLRRNAARRLRVYLRGRQGR